MKTTLTQCQFIDEMKRSAYSNNFSYDGLCALFSFFEECENDSGEEIEFDPCAIACDFTEYNSLEEFKKIYSDENIQRITSIDEVNDFTFCLEVEGGGLIIQNF